MKSSVDEIRQRFDADVERFSNLATGQSATVDAPLVLDLITGAAAGPATALLCSYARGSSGRERGVTVSVAPPASLARRPGLLYRAVLR